MHRYPDCEDRTMSEKDKKQKVAHDLKTQAINQIATAMEDRKAWKTIILNENYLSRVQRSSSCCSCSSIQYNVGINKERKASRMKNIISIVR